MAARDARARERSGRMTRKAMEARRFEALDLFRAGFSPASIARALGVSRTSASRWARLASTHNQLRMHKATGRPCRVPPDQIALIRSGRAKWTLAAFAQAVFDATGVRYNPDYCSKLLGRRAYGPVDGKYGIYIGTLAESPSGSERPRTLLTSEPRFATAEEAAAAAESLIVAIRKAENEVTT